MTKDFTLKFKKGSFEDFLRQMTEVAKEEIMKGFRESEGVTNVTTTSRTTSDSMEVDVDVELRDGYRINDDITDVQNIPLGTGVKTLIAPEKFIFLSMRDPQCCVTCTLMDYRVTLKVWTVKQINAFMAKGKFAYTKKNGRKKNYAWKGKYHAVKDPVTGATAYMGVTGGNLLHPNCRCKWIPLSLYQSGLYKKMGI